jgi:hypothetical protein
MVPSPKPAVLCTNWLTDKQDNVQPLHSLVQHFGLECNHNRKKYALLGKCQPNKKQH